MKHTAREEIIRFGHIIVEWSRKNPRSLPWKNFSDPYRIWIAEIILQQTRVEQGRPYYERFLRHFPDLSSLASATIDEVLIVWEGLGYYSRARNLHHTARYVWNELSGQFPDNSAGLQTLKGIGPYSAAAIASFAYGEQVGVVDGNVKRVVSRYFNITENVESGAVKRRMQTLVNEVVRHIPSPEFNQAIMNFGALNCIPQNPDCGLCPASPFCAAYNLGTVHSLPVKGKSQIRQERWVRFGVYVEDGQIALVHNRESNIWRNLYMFPVIGTDSEFKPGLKAGAGGSFPDFALLGEMVWMLTHRKLKLQFYLIKKWPSQWKTEGNIRLVDQENLSNFALPRPLRLFLNQNYRKLGIKINHDQ